MESQVEAVATLVVSEVSGASVPAAEVVQAREVESSSKRPSMVGGVAEYDDWSRTGLSLRAERENNDGGIAWQAAKWLVHGYRTFLGKGASNQDKGRLIKNASRHSGLSTSTLITYIKVGLAFPDGPILELSFAHHRAVIAIPSRDDRAYWLRQAASKEMSVSILKKAIKELIPSKPKLGIDPVQEAERYASRLQKLNPRDSIWTRIIREIEGGRSIEDYRQLHNEMKKSADVLFLNFQQIESALAGRISSPICVQEHIKSSELVEAEQMEAIGSAVDKAA